MAYGLTSGFIRWLSYQEPVKLLLIGLDNAGKTSLLEVLERGPNDTGSPLALPCPRPTVGLNLGSLSIRGRPVTVWDLGGAEGLRGIWAQYYDEAQVIVFVVDAARREKLAEAKATLGTVLDSLKQTTTPLLVLAHKQDAGTAASAADLASVLGLNGLPADDRASVVLGTSCTDIEGLMSAMDWAVKATS